MQVLFMFVHCVRHVLQRRINIIPCVICNTTEHAQQSTGLKSEGALSLAMKR